jgi:hypothetical protein
MDTLGTQASVVSRSSRRSRLLRGSLLTLVLLATASSTMAAKAPSGVSSRAPHRTAPALALPNGASASTYIACSQTMHWMRRTVTIRPQRGFSTQAVAWRSYIQPAGGAGFWTGWTSGTAPYQQIYGTNFTNVNLTVYMQYAWWNGYSWAYAGEWITSYAQVQGMSTWTIGYCAA